MKKLISILVLGLSCNAADLLITWDANPKTERILYYRLKHSIRNSVKIIEIPAHQTYYRITNVPSGPHLISLSAKNLISESKPVFIKTQIP